MNLGRQHGLQVPRLQKEPIKNQRQEHLHQVSTYKTSLISKKLSINNTIRLFWAHTKIKRKPKFGIFDTEKSYLLG